MKPNLIIWQVPDKNGVTHTFILHTDFFPSKADFVLFALCEHQENKILTTINKSLPDLWESINSKMSL